MADLLSISTGVIDGTTASNEVGPLNRINFQLSEIGDGIAMVVGVFSLHLVQDR